MFTYVLLLSCDFRLKLFFVFLTVTLKYNFYFNPKIYFTHIMVFFWIPESANVLISVFIVYSFLPRGTYY